MKKQTIYLIIFIVLAIVAVLVLKSGVLAALIVAICGGILIDKLLEMTHKNATTGNAVIASLIGIAFFFIVLETATGELVCGVITAVVGVIDLILCFKK
jgi:CDP-diglyceride synthetase